MINLLIINLFLMQSQNIFHKIDNKILFTVIELSTLCLV